MQDTHTNFVQANLASPVCRIMVAAKYTTYHLENGDRFRLNKNEIEMLGNFIARNDFKIKLASALRQRLGEYR